MNKKFPSKSFRSVAFAGASPRTALCGLMMSAIPAAAHAATLPTDLAHPEVARWNTVTIASGSKLPRLAPRFFRSDDKQLKKELNEVLSLQAARTPAQIQAAFFYDQNAVLGWNAIARSLVASHSTPPPQAARFYALFSIAQYDALVAAYANKYAYFRSAPAAYDNRVKPLFLAPPDPAYPSEAAVVAGASASVIEYIYPDAKTITEQRVREIDDSRVLAGVNFRSDVIAGDALGRLVAKSTVAYGKADGAERIAKIHYGPSQIPKGPGFWTGTDPLLPEWGRVRPWLIPDITALRPPPPPTFGSPQFQKALAQVRDISDHRTPQQLAIAQFWGDGAGTPTPPGHWNQIAADLIANAKMSEPYAARVLALENMALMDAGIACWDVKYTYWLIRPYQADPAITTPVGQPNFPSYTSGHATFSGAAATMLSFAFPGKSAQLQAMAEEAALSRVYGGIHYNFDGSGGLQGGDNVSDEISMQLGRNIATAMYQRAALAGLIQ